MRLARKKGNGIAVRLAPILAAKKGDNLRGRLGAGIRSKHGFDSAALIQFGFTPRRSKRHPEDEPGEVAAIPGEEEADAPEEPPPRSRSGRKVKR